MLFRSVRYLYDAKAHQLQPVAKGDYRSAVAGQQDFVTEAPGCLILVAFLYPLYFAYPTG